MFLSKHKEQAGSSFCLAGAGDLLFLFQVMVWIHGGGLLVGAASTYDGSTLTAFEDVVVVAIQYRLGILGFYR